MTGIPTNTLPAFDQLCRSLVPVSVSLFCGDDGTQQFRSGQREEVWGNPAVRCGKSVEQERLGDPWIRMLLRERLPSTFGRSAAVKRVVEEHAPRLVVGMNRTDDPSVPDDRSALIGPPED